MSQDRPSTGELIARYRYRRGMTQEQLAEASGLSVSAVKAIERGVRAGRMGTLHQLAAALGVRTSDLLIPAAGASILDEAEPDGLHAIRQVLTPPLGRLPDPGPTPAIQAWRARLASAEAWYENGRYDAALAAAPMLLTEARALVEADARNADALAHAYLYLAQILTQVRRLDLAHHALGQAMDAARACSDEVLAASVVMIQCWTMLLQRRLAEVEQSAVHTAGLVEPRMSEPASPRLAVWGWLMLRAAAAAVRDARREEAEQYMQQARAAAARMGGVPGEVARVQRQLPLGARGFATSTVAYKDVENAVLYREPGQALQLAGQVPATGFSTPDNRNRHRLDVASAQLAVRDPGAAIRTLMSVRETSPDWLRRQGYARDLVGRLVESRRRADAEQIGLLADHVGVPG
jgi:transcriptional regulator with XRE-family HTH domain